jgi:hypothetical protein
MDVLLHALWGGWQSSCLKLATVQLAGASTMYEKEPSPRELRTTTLIVWEGTSPPAAAEGGRIHQFDTNRRMNASSSGSFQKETNQSRDAGAEAAIERTIGVCHRLNSNSELGICFL